MTCLALVRDKNAGVWIASDAIGYDDDGVVVAIHQKVTLMPHISAVIASSGAGHFSEVLYQRLGWKLQSFDHLLELVGDVAEDLHRQYVDHYQYDDFVNMALAGWSDARQRFETYSLSSQEQQDHSPDRVVHPAWTLIPLPYIWVSAGLGKDGAEIGRRFGLDWPNLDAGGGVDPVGMTCRLVCAARARSGPLKAEASPDRARYYGVGGFLQLTVLARDCVRSEILHRWPDKVGEPHDANSGEPMPPDLPPAVSKTIEGEG